MMNRRVEEIVRNNKPDINRLEQSQFRNKKDIHQHLQENQIEWYRKSIDAFYEFSRYNLNQSFIDQPLALIYVIDHTDSDN